MNESQVAILSGPGFVRLFNRHRRVLRITLLSSLVLHAVALMVFGGWIIMRSFTENSPVFRTPPPARRYEPRVLEHKVKLTKRARSSSRPSVLPRMVAVKFARLALPEIKMDPKQVHRTFQPHFQPAPGKGLGAGLGDGYATDGWADGVSKFDFFDIHGRGEKIAVLVDVSVSMVEEQKGGVAGYWRVKQRIGQVMDALNEGTLFNVIVFADAAKMMTKKMLIANPGNKSKAKQFLNPFNTAGNWGLSDGNVQASGKGVRAAGGTTRLDLALTAAFLQGADTILVISDGIPRVRKVWSSEQAQALAARQQKWMQENAGQIAAWEQASAAYGAAAQVVSEKVWIPPQPAVPPRPPSKRPPREGQAPDRGDPGRPAQPGHWRVVTRAVGGQGSRPGPRPRPPEIPDPGWWTLSDFVAHLAILHQDEYRERGKKLPVVHCIGYRIDDEGHAFLQGLAKQYAGEYRRVRTVK